jgi:hypothetical protein
MWLQLIQGGSVAKNPGYKDHVGKFAYIIKDGDTYEAIDSFDEIRAIFLGVKMVGRTLLPPYDPKASDTTPICESYDGQTPSSRIDNPESEKCGEFVSTTDGRVTFKAECPRAKWLDGSPPECQDYQVIEMLNIADGVPFELRLKGTALGNWTKFVSKGLSSIKKRQRLLRMKNKNSSVSMMDYAFVLTSENKGTYYTLNVTIEEDPRTKNMYPLAQLYKQMLQQRKERFLETQKEYAALAEKEAESVSLEELEEGAIEVDAEDSTQIDLED